MAEKDAFVSTNPQSHITRQEFNALLASHRAFHEVAIKVTDILQDPSRSAYYQPQPRTSDSDTSVGLIEYKQNSTEDDRLFSGQQSAGIKDDSSWRLLQRQEREPATDETPPRITFESENMRARKSYSQKRQRSIGMYARALGSYPDTEYDFQCNFNLGGVLLNSYMLILVPKINSLPTNYTNNHKILVSTPCSGPSKHPIIQTSTLTMLIIK